MYKDGKRIVFIQKTAGINPCPTNTKRTTNGVPTNQVLNGVWCIFCSYFAECYRNMGQCDRNITKDYSLITDAKSILTHKKMGAIIAIE